MRKRIKITNFKDWDTMFYNSKPHIPFNLNVSWLVFLRSASNTCLGILLFCCRKLVTNKLGTQFVSEHGNAIEFFWHYSSPSDSRFVLISAIAFSGGAAVFISYATAWCLRVCGPTAYSMVGALNKLPVAASGMIFFGDPVTATNVGAVGTGFFAGIVCQYTSNFTTDELFLILFQMPLLKLIKRSKKRSMLRPQRFCPCAPTKLNKLYRIKLTLRCCFANIYDAEW